VYALSASNALSAAGLVGYWTLDEGRGLSAADSSGNGNTGSLFNAPVWTSAGHFNGALSFAATNAAVVVPGGGVLADLSRTGVTVAGWIKPTSAGGGGKGRILHKTNWMLYMGSASTVLFTADNWTTQFAQRTSTASITLNTWQHVAATWDGSQSGSAIHIYVNGVLADGASVDGAGTTVSDAAQALYLGNIPGSLTRGFDGTLDDVRVYNRVLTASEIQALLAGVPSTDTTPPTQPGSPKATPVSSSRIDLTWTASTDNVGVTGYRLERCQGPSCTSFSQVAIPAASPYSDIGLSAATIYRYRVRAADANGNLSVYSSIFGATTNSSGGTSPPPSGSGIAGKVTYQYDSRGRLEQVTVQPQ
jgi:hypothetical protein